MPPSTPMLSVANLRVAFGRQTVIDDLSFEVRPGETLAVIGPNGAGKTVLLKALLHLIPYQGEIRWSPDARLGYVPQKVAADRQLPLRLGDLLAAKAAVQKLAETDIASVTSEVGLSPQIFNTSIGHLSGGQFQKALIAFALLGRPNVLLFDEPTASLDELAEEHTYELLHSLQQKKNMTAIFVSHDLSVVYRYATMVLCLSRGTRCMGPPKELLTPAMLEQLYGGPSKFYRHMDHQ
ncbi:MAG TPA: metal ABC transporter ATP-binding protein [Candidatus Dormibacteraeota bacterium]|nr:metal ABC transporter ATP-binding protein [Candidatus Dormibacteraeota bacterium]